MKTFNI
jgi:hypothetical protein